MRARLWDQDWFEDPVWRAERVNAINAHFITAFLDRYVRGEVSRDSYLNVPVPDADAGTWPTTDTAPYAAFSSGANGNSVWKGFQRSHAAGLELQRPGRTRTESRAARRCVPCSIRPTATLLQSRTPASPDDDQIRPEGHGSGKSASLASDGSSITCTSVYLPFTRLRKKRTQRLSRSTIQTSGTSWAAYSGTLMSWS